MPSLIGNRPNQCPTNGDLGKLAFMDIVDTVSHNPYYDTAISDVQPTLNLDFVNAKTLDSRITFARASTASFYDAKSSAVAEQNLLTYSQDYTQSSWAKSNVTNTANSTTAPDGTTTASLITPSAGTSNKEIQVAGNFLLNQVNTVSFYVKQNTQQFVQILIYSATSQAANFDLTNGTSQNLNSGVSTITSVGSSWYRITLSFTPAVNGNISLAVVDSLGAARGATTASVNTYYLWGGQLEQRSAATAYTPTTTTAITNYIPTLQTAANNVARLDYDPITREPKGLLIEESRANLTIYSADFSNAAWTKTNATITNTAAISPDGSQNAQLLIPTTGSSAKFIITAAAFGANTYTQTIHAKYYGTQYLWISLDGVVTGGFFDLINGTIASLGTGNTGTITPVGNGWYRCSITKTVGTSTNVSYGLSSSTSFTTTGNAYSGIFIWGAQLEAGAFPTSYIPTVASQVTRAADAASMTGTNFSSWFNSSQGTLFASYDYPLANSNGRVFDTNPVAAGSYCVMQANGNASGWHSSGLTSLGTAVSTVNKQVLKYSNPYNFAGSLNGNAVVSSTASDFMGTSTSFRLGVGNTIYLNGHIQKLQYYPVALPNAELQEMTA